MNQPQLSVFNFSIKNQSDDTVDINVDGYIVDSPSLEMYRQYWGDETSVSYKSFRDSIPSNVKTINLIVNSGGGHVGDAMAIHDFLSSLENDGVTVNREGRGIVASAATYLVMGKNSRLSENCLFMIHEVSGFAYGDVSSMENQVKAMRKFNDLIVDFYARETGLTATVVGNMMKQETWLNATDAKEKGFVKSTGPKVNLTNQISKEHWPFQNTAMLNTYNNFFKNSNPSEMDTTKITEAITNGFNSLMEKIGIKDKANDENVQNAFKEFSSSITNAIGEIKPDEESVKTLVSNAVTESLKNIADNQSFKDAISNSLKEVPENFKNAIADATKNSVTKDDFKKGMTDLTNAVIEKIGGKSSGEGGEQNPGNKKKAVVKNRFAAAYEDYMEE
jgi:ATP-dependent protease ClpP protease subunit